MGAIAFVDKKHRLTIVDQEGHTRTVPATKDVLLPAWSPDGTRIAWLQKAGRDRYVIVAIDVREHN
jgi:Tol biopolymer transport system component